MGMPFSGVAVVLAVAVIVWMLTEVTLAGVAAVG